LAAAYGIAVSLTMLMTSALLFIAMREVWGWSILAAGSVAAFFFVIDAAFFLANLTKIADGGYVPLILATSVYSVMWIWHRGAAAVMARMHESLIPVPEFLKDIQSKNIPRVPGTAVFLTRTKRDTPPVMVWHVNPLTSCRRSSLACSSTSSAMASMPLTSAVARATELTARN
jgi:KUP system potassium uptake protein